MLGTCGAAVGARSSTQPPPSTRRPLARIQATSPSTATRRSWWESTTSRPWWRSHSCQRSSSIRSSSATSTSRGQRRSGATTLMTAASRPAVACLRRLGQHAACESGPSPHFCWGMQNSMPCTRLRRRAAPTCTCTLGRVKCLVAGRRPGTGRLHRAQLCRGICATRGGGCSERAWCTTQHMPWSTWSQVAAPSRTSTCVGEPEPGGCGGVQAVEGDPRVCILAVEHTPPHLCKPGPATPPHPLPVQAYEQHQPDGIPQHACHN
jgi:hypothetical protein